MDEATADYHRMAREMIGKKLPASLVADRLQEAGAGPYDATNIAYSEKISQFQKFRMNSIGAALLGVIFMIAGGGAVSMMLVRLGAGLFLIGLVQLAGGFWGIRYSTRNLASAEKVLEKLTAETDGLNPGMSVRA
ncbi:hypothetical protein BH11PSE2_BH11PSE2_18800 [soil metagenome]